TLCPCLSLMRSLPLMDCSCSSDKEPDSLLIDNVKQAVLHGLQDALGKSKNDDISGLKLSVIREGVAAALKESLSQYNICFDCDDTDPHIRIMIQEAVEEGLKAYGYQIPKKDSKSGESPSLMSGHAHSTVSGFRFLPFVTDLHWALDKHTFLVISPDMLCQHLAVHFF
uniref:Uncharacterized protein n=1 Tax=Aegilops tauschii subsp. strangulata TaxID=200361 RepID=A0A452ZTW1_AEGTS